MKKITRALALLLALALCFTVAACNRQDDNPGGQGGQEQEPPTPQDGPGPEENEPAFTLAVEDSLGAALASGLDAWKYGVSRVDDCGAALKDGAATAALMSVGRAAKLYNETDGGYVLWALITSGGWELVSIDGSVTSPADLGGKTVTVTAPGSEAAAVLKYIAQQGAVETQISVSADIDGADPVLVPAGSGIEGASGFTVLDAWKSIGRGSLPGLCVVAPAGGDVSGLLADLKAYFDSANIAFPGTELTWLTGSDALREELTDYLSFLRGLDPELIGTYLPDDGFYME